MATLIVTETCENCGIHTGTIPLNCFDEATGATLAILSEMAEIHEIAELARTWLGQEGNEVVTLEFTNWEGRDTFLTYSV